MTNLCLIIGNNIRKKRLDMNLSIEKLASKSDLSSNQLGQIERGLSIPKVDTLERIAKAINADVRTLLINEKNSKAIEMIEIQNLLDTLSTKELRIIKKCLTAYKFDE